MFTLHGIISVVGKKESRSITDFEVVADSKPLELQNTKE